ncbi:MAG: hypothetical protein LBF83_00395 [Spirochaetaceae bacterium]|jgi:hypothetical protein|nr:hypothetical protein [Spirochaetaceae bacterium]
MKGSFADMRESFADMRESFADMRKSFADMRKSFTDMRESFADMRKSFADMSGDFADTSGKVPGGFGGDIGVSLFGRRLDRAKKLFGVCRADTAAQTPMRKKQPPVSRAYSMVKGLNPSIPGCFPYPLSF